VVITPGTGFGSKGEGYFRISAFNSRANAEEVARRLPALKVVNLECGDMSPPSKRGHVRAVPNPHSEFRMGQLVRADSSRRSFAKTEIR